MDKIIKVRLDSEKKDFCDCLVDGVAKEDGLELLHCFWFGNFWDKTYEGSIQVFKDFSLI